MVRIVNMSRVLILLLLALPALPQETKQAPRDTDPAKAGIGRVFSDPALTAGLQEVQLLVVAFSGPDCPISKLYRPKMDRMTREYAAKGVRILTVSSDDKAFVGLFGPERTTETFVLDAKGVLRYRGAVDDQYGIGYSKAAPTQTYLIDAIEALLAGKTPRVPATVAPGCAVESLAKSTAPAGAAKVTFHKDVEPVFQKHCVVCHRPGEMGPMSLLKYEKAKASSKQIREVVTQRRMPPWHADPKIGEWKNDRRLTQGEIDTVAKWVDAGAPEGDAKDAPPPPKFPEGWRIGKPDVIYSLQKPEKIPAEGVFPYRAQIVPTGLKEDRWVRAVEIHPSAKQVVHHVLVFVLYPLNRMREQPKIDGLNNYLGIYVPGEYYAQFPEGAAKYLPAGSFIMFEIHYTANGEPAEDMTQVGLLWSKEPPKMEIVTQSATNTKFRIPAGASDSQQEATYTFDYDATMISLLPHMHMRGKSFKYVAIAPDGTQEVLLDVPHYDFNWQTSYLFKEPKRVLKGTQIRAYARFDNSKNNPWNPDPTLEVRWGKQTWEEMLVGYIDHLKEKK